MDDTNKLSEERALGVITHPAPASADMRAVCDALGFDPTNHHNAAKCPYCRPSASASVAGASEPLQAMADGALGLGYETGASEDPWLPEPHVYESGKCVQFMGRHEFWDKGDVLLAIREAVCAALSKPAGQGDGEAVPAGFWLAPMEPTVEMVTAKLSHPHGPAMMFRAMRDAWLARHPQTLVHADVERLDDLEAAKHFHHLVGWSEDLGCWLTPGNFEHSTFREALDEVLEGYRKSRYAIADAARQPSTEGGANG